MTDSTTRAPDHRIVEGYCFDCAGGCMLELAEENTRRISEAGQMVASEVALLAALQAHDEAWGRELHRCRHTRALRLAIEETGHRLVPSALLDVAEALEPLARIAENCEDLPREGASGIATAGGSLSWDELDAARAALSKLRESE